MHHYGVDWKFPVRVIGMIVTRTGKSTTPTTAPGHYKQHCDFSKDQIKSLEK